MTTVYLDLATITSLFRPLPFEVLSIIHEDGVIEFYYHYSV